MLPVTRRFRYCLDMGDLVDSTRAKVRAKLRELFRDSASFDAFCVDYYPDIAARFQQGMDRVERENLLLLAKDGDHVAASIEALRQISLAKRNRTLRSAMILTFCGLLVAIVTGWSSRLMERQRTREDRQVFLETLTGCVDNRHCMTLFQNAKQFCEQGEVAGCLLAAAMMRTGTGTEKDSRMALSQFEKLCESHYWPACHVAGQVLLTGEVMKSPTRARELFSKACENRYYASCVSSARAFWAEKDAYKAKHFYQIACDAGVAVGCTGLGSLYETGEGVPSRNFDEAMKEYQKACQQGEPHACRNIGMMYREGVPGFVTIDYRRAFNEFERACNMQGGAGCRNLGYAYRHGEGVNPDASKAFLSYEKSCELRDALGCFNLADMYDSGDLGKKNSEQALHYYRMSCDLNVADGCLMVGRLHNDGKFIVPQPAVAKQYFELACRLNSEQGCNLAKLFK